MRKLSFLIALLICSSSCDDGDIITVEIEFGDTFLSCGELVFYQTKEFPYETLSLQITNPTLVLEDFLQVDDNGNLIADNPLIVGIDGVSNTFNFRKYNTFPNDFFCNDVPPSNIIITEDSSSPGGTATINVFLLEDDDDGMAVFDKPDRVKISKNLSDILGETRLFRPNFKNKTLPWQAR